MDKNPCLHEAYIPVAKTNNKRDVFKKIHKMSHDEKPHGEK